MQTFRARRTTLVPLLGLAALTACESGSALMAPGEDCVSCHATLTVAGTVFFSATAAADGGLAGVVVTVVDGAGVETRLTSNDAGNFYTHARLTLPLRGASLALNGRTRAMDGGPGGACNSCHADPALDGGPGRLFVP